MTKQAADEPPFKFALPMEAASKAAADTLVICGTQVGSELEEELESLRRRNEIENKRILGKIMSELYNLEENVETEKPLKIDLDLDIYQMEKV